MTIRTQTFTIADPRTFDGNPFEVAQRAVTQAAAIARILDTAIEHARIMARNAEMEREIIRDEEPNAPGFDDSAQGRSYAAASEALADIEKRLALLTKVAGFNPRAPLDTPA